MGDEGSGFLLTEPLKPWGSREEQRSPAAAFGAHQEVACRPQSGVSSVTGVAMFDHYSVLRGRHCHEPRLQMGKTEKLDYSARITQGEVAVAGQNWIRVIPVSKPKTPPSKAPTPPTPLHPISPNSSCAF